MSAECNFSLCIVIHILLLISVLSSVLFKASMYVENPEGLGYKNVGKTQNNKKDAAVFVGLLLVMEGGGTLIDIMTTPGGALRPDDWYEKLNKPLCHPPDWVFGPVWSILYFMIALSAFKVYRKIGFSLTLPWMVFLVQITLNFTWPLIFFIGRQLGGFIDILIMLVFIILNISVFLPIEYSAGLLLLPYLVWITFTSYLNYALWTLNPDTSSLPSIES